MVMHLIRSEMTAIHPRYTKVSLLTNSVFSHAATPCFHDLSRIRCYTLVFEVFAHLFWHFCKKVRFDQIHRSIQHQNGCHSSPGVSTLPKPLGKKKLLGSLRHWLPFDLPLFSLGSSKTVLDTPATLWQPVLAITRGVAAIPRYGVHVFEKRQPKNRYRKVVYLQKLDTPEDAPGPIINNNNKPESLLPLQRTSYPPPGVLPPRNAGQGRPRKGGRG